MSENTSDGTKGILGLGKSAREINRAERIPSSTRANDSLGRVSPRDRYHPSQTPEKPGRSETNRCHFDVQDAADLQRLYNLSDAELEYQVNDRISFMRFLRLGLEDRVPDSSTLWLFREQLIKAKVINLLFEKFDEILNNHGYKAKEGQIVDASFVPVPRQHNTREENEDIKQGKLPKDWKENPQKASQKDGDARWKKKNGQSHFGYKNHVGIDKKYGFIRRYAVRDASVHDSQQLMKLLDIENESDEVWGDSAYRSELEEKVLALMGFNSHIHERSYRNRPLSEEQKVKNRERSRVRAKVEHNFGCWVNEMGGKAIEVIGEVRATAVIGLRNLAYNMKRFVYWQKQITG